MTGQPFILTRQSDGFGSRLHAILNAWSVARALELEFRFVWPRNSCIGHSDPEEIFSSDFLLEHELSDFSCCPNTVEPKLRRLTASQAKTFCDEYTGDAVIVGDSFQIIKFTDESEEVASQRFRQGLNEISWNPRIAELIKVDLIAGMSAIHVRAGDIIFGNWRQSWPVKKYLPTCFISLTARALHEQGVPVVVLSDNQEYVAYLKKEFSNILTPPDIISGYTILTTVQQAFTDVLVLSRASSLYAPVLSNFSQLAAHVGGTQLQGLSDHMHMKDLQDLLFSYIEKASIQEQPEVLRPLLSRDACWLLDVFGDSLPLQKRIWLASQAVEYDQGFVCAHTRLALTSALAGHRSEAAVAAEKARIIAAGISLFHDAELEATACCLCIQILALDPHIPVIRTEEDPDRLHDAQELLATCERLNPCMIQQQDVLMNLRFLVATLHWLARAGPATRQSFLEGLHDCLDQTSDLRHWRLDGFTLLHSSIGPYPAALRTIEEVTIRVSEALGRLLQRHPHGTQRIAICRVESLNRSPSGLHMVAGWAHDGISSKHTLLGCIHSDGSISGTLTFMEKPELAKQMGIRNAAHCGYCMPMPLPSRMPQAARTGAIRKPWTFITAGSGVWPFSPRQELFRLRIYLVRMYRVIRRSLPMPGR
ncbi:hypothetical protein H6G65_15780 [Microcystis elabens FACHB-917]|nr:hypothetical protein [Microcystis elabens FACHB-917]